MTSNQIRYWELQETKRSNRAREREMRRSNRANEMLTQQYQEGTLGLRAQELAETVRSHQATEAVSLANVQETARHNLAYETELTRHNRESEALNARQLDISASTLAETIRSHKVNESISFANISELRRHNIAQEGIAKGQLDLESRYKNAMIEQGLQRINLDTQHVENERRRVVNDTYARIEAARHNREIESVQKEQNELRGYDILVHGIESAFRIGSSVAMAMA